ncbi:ubiquinol-cytochrome c reductase iron-sulfur subunit [Hanamia caeni]|uniref:Ubiquinol-cytochrome c reductase iron-sulfur subunit n=1 Tax=Hanamia caeni TaxID=2294116 RepID=A0A3M9NNI7_9BACT|nr:ubiquinol-cytochrome c reductase iron-sulfur subunit [Hanamia caeni]RNI38723.1 ubiquinol-cytochrome c reductase iron-sulfur subunit [Hanamia caeni]
MNEQAQNEEISRRDFFLKISLGLAGISAIAAAVPVVSAIIAPLLKKKNQLWRTVGKVDDFQTGSTSLVTFINADPEPYAGVTAKSAAWLRKNDENNFIAFAANCTHLGCPVRWENEAHLFMCPCHGGVYYADGTVAGGPPPKPLNQYEVRVFNKEVQIKTAPVPITGSKA